MRRSICMIEPPFAKAGEVATWKFVYTTATALPKGAKLKFDLQSKGRSIDWEIPDSNIKAKKNVIWAYVNKMLMEAEEIEVGNTYVPQFEFTLPCLVKAGEKIVIVMGAPPKVKEKHPGELGNMAQLLAQRRRSFLLSIDPKGKGNYEEPEIFSTDIRGNTLTSIRILAPSFVAKNKRFDLTIRFEDEFGNLTNCAPPETLIELTYENLRENLSWKLFIPETGFVILPNLYFNEAGIYRIRLNNLKDKSSYTSPPIKCFQENDRNLFWGLLHGESERVDSTENIESCLRHFRDEKTINFFASSPFEVGEETSNEIWKLISQNIQEFNEEDRFISLLGFQYKGEPKKEGVRQFIYLKDAKPLIRQKEAKSSTLSKIYKSLSPKEAIAIPTFTMGGSANCFNFEDFNPEFERVVEIYNAWGSSEKTSAEGNKRPITGGLEASREGSILAALKKNCRFGFVAGGLDDRGCYGNFYDSDQVQYSPGMTGIMAKKYNRESLFEALYDRCCYATTGPRIIVGFYVAGFPMGSELNTNLKPGLIVNRHISGFVAGEADLALVEIIRNGEVLKSFSPNSYHLDYYHDDMEPLTACLLEGKGKPPFAFYYLRVTQKDGHMAWSSPIWVDCHKEATKKLGK